MVKDKLLISSCLLGECVRYDGKGGSLDQAFLAYLKANFDLVSFCPECEGGLPTPRVPAEIVGGSGAEVIDGSAKVITSEGGHVSEQFLKGAAAAAACCKENQIELCVLKERSPSCGTMSIYDGTFSGKVKPGSGVTAALLERSGVAVFSDEEFERFKKAVSNKSGGK